MRDINTIFSELAQYSRIQEETAAIVDGLKDEIKAIMNANNTDTITGNEHKATWKQVTQNKIDTTNLKSLYPEIAKQLTVETSYKRFTFK